MDLALLVMAGVVVLVVGMVIWRIKPGTVSSFKLKFSGLEIEVLAKENRKEQETNEEDVHRN